MTDEWGAAIHPSTETHELQPSFMAIAQWMEQNAGNPEQAKIAIRAMAKAFDRAEHGLWPLEAVLLACGLTALFTALTVYAIFH